MKQRTKWTRQDAISVAWILALFGLLFTIRDGKLLRLGPFGLVERTTALRLFMPPVTLTWFIMMVFVERPVTTVALAAYMLMQLCIVISWLAFVQKM